MAARWHRSTSTASRVRRGSKTLALSSALLVGVAAPALAAPPVDLAGAYVVDEAGVLGGDLARVESAIDRLFEASGAGLYVIVCSG